MFSERLQTSEQTVGEECGVRTMDQILSPCWPRWACAGALFGADDRERLRSLIVRDKVGRAQVRRLVP